MELLKAQLARIQEQLSSLTVSQRMLSVALVTIMVMTVAYWSRYAGTAQMEPLLGQSFTPDEIAPITRALAAKSIAYSIEGDRILVAADRRIEALADLSYSQLMPQNTRRGYDELIAKINPWQTRAETEATRIDAKARYLSDIIRNFPNVATADVFIDPTSERRVGGGREPRATVHITTRSGEAPDKRLVLGAADLVAGAQSGLSRANVAVIVNGVSYPVPEKSASNMLAGADILEAIKSAETQYADKIRDQLAFIPGVLVSVTADVENSIRQEKSIDFDPTKVASKESEITTDTKEETTSSNASREPGAVPNSALTIADGSTGGGVSSQTSSETSKTRMENRFSEKHTEVMTPAGKPRPVAASVRVPRSYFVNVWKSLNSAATQDPTDAEMAEMVRAQLDSIREDVVRCMGAIGSEAIVVQTYNDIKPMYAAGIGVAAPGAAQGSVTRALTSNVKELVIGALAVVSLFMVMMMVRKSSPAPALAIPTVSVPAPVEIGPAEAVVGVVGGEGAQLDGIEVDDDSIRAQQMVEQVQTLVKENPDVAANLLKRWLSRE